MINKKLNFAFTGLLVLTLLCLQAPSSAKTSGDLSKAAIIPKPVSVTATGDYFRLKMHANICILEESKELRQIGQYLADKLKGSTGYGLQVITTTTTEGSGNIYLILSKNNSGSNPADEGYKLIITKKQILLTANSPVGLFRGVQTIRQLRSEEHTSELQSRQYLVCRLL